MCGENVNTLGTHYFYLKAAEMNLGVLTKSMLRFFSFKSHSPIKINQFARLTSPSVPV